jgi:TRAP-type C4-dicarboxylate transport system permease small subunit
MPPALRVATVLLAEVVVIGFFAVLGWYGYQVLVILEGDAMVSLPWVPTRFTQSVIPIGAVLFILAQLFSLPELLTQARGEGVIDADQQDMQKELQKAQQS